MDEVLLYRAGDLIVDDDLTLNSLNTSSLLVGGLVVRPVLITKFSTVNINAAASTPLVMSAIDEFNNMATAAFKQSTSIIEIAEAGTYYVNFILNCTASTSSVQIQFLKGASVVATANISPSDSGMCMSFPISLIIGDLLSFNSVRVSGIAAKNLFVTSSALYLTKL